MIVLECVSCKTNLVVWILYRETMHRSGRCWAMKSAMSSISK